MILKIEHLLAGIAFSEDGFMIDPETWTVGIAEAIAEWEGVELTERHWLVINFAREVFGNESEGPTLRRINLETDVKTKELYSLFPGGPGKKACMIAGLEKPTGCI